MHLVLPSRTRDAHCIQDGMDVSAIDFVFLRRGGLQDQSALDKQEDRRRIEERVIREEYEVGLQNGRPHQRGEDPDAGLCEDA